MIVGLGEVEGRGGCWGRGVTQTFCRCKGCSRVVLHSSSPIGPHPHPHLPPLTTGADTFYCVWFQSFPSGRLATVIFDQFHVVLLVFNGFEEAFSCWSFVPYFFTQLWRIIFLHVLGTARYYNLPLEPISGGPSAAVGVSSSLFRLVRLSDLSIT